MEKGDYIQGSSAWERFVHWVLAVSFLVLLLTGLGMMFKAFGVISATFGGAQNLKAIHDWMAWVFMVSLVVSILTWAKDCISFDADDKAWLSKLGGYLGGEKTHFETGKFNAGQKLFFLVAVLIGGILMSLSGLAMMYPGAVSRGTVQLSQTVHSLFTLISGVFVLLHIYLGTLANPGTAGIIFHGRVTRAWARVHRSKWLKKQGAGI